MRIIVMYDKEPTTNIFIFRTDGCDYCCLVLMLQSGTGQSIYWVSLSQFKRPVVYRRVSISGSIYLVLLSLDFKLLTGHASLNAKLRQDQTC